MKELLSNYSLSELLLFAMFLFIGIKEFVSLVDWFKGRIKQYFDKDNEAKEEHEKIENEIQDLNKFYSEKKKVDAGFEAIYKSIAEMNARIDMLIDSDKESIKSYITDRHHYFVEDRKWIDYYSMDCLERRFAIYEKEKGNTYVEDLMNEIRQLPKKPLTDI